MHEPHPPGGDQVTCIVQCAAVHEIHVGAMHGVRGRKHPNARRSQRRREVPLPYEHLPCEDTA